MSKLRVDALCASYLGIKLLSQIVQSPSFFIVKSGHFQSMLLPELFQCFLLLMVEGLFF